MGGLEDEVPAPVDELTFALGVGTPKHIDDVVAFAIECSDSRVGQFLPPFSLMTTGSVRFDSKGSIEQENALLCPASEVS